MSRLNRFTYCAPQWPPDGDAYMGGRRVATSVVTEQVAAREEQHMVPAYRDASQPAAARVDDLLSRMTLREKVGQLNQRLLGWRTWTREADRIRTTEVLDEQIERWSGVGAIARVSLTPAVLGT